MGAHTRMEAFEASWNPTYGCSAVSSGCKHCYARRIAAHSAKPGQVYYGVAKYGEHTGLPRWTGRLVLAEAHLQDPLDWSTKGRRIAVASMSDLFHERIPDAWRDTAFGVIALCGQHQFYVLTKRAANMQRYFLDPSVWRRIEAEARRIYRERYKGEYPSGGHLEGPLPNTWLGVSVEHQRAADRRVPLLLGTPALHRWVAVEPLLHPVRLDAVRGEDGAPRNAFAGLDWVMVSGEGGPESRLCRVAWISALIAQARAAGKPVFLKQLGTVSDAPRLYSEVGAGVLSPVERHADMELWPAELRVRELPGDAEAKKAA